MIKMSGVLRSSLKLYPSCGFMNAFRQTISPGNAKQRLYSTLWNTSMKSTETNALKSVAVWNKCSISSKQYATRSESELAEFLEQEIDQERKVQKHDTIPSKIDEFEVKLDGSEVTLVKSLPNETVKVNFSINNSLNDPDDVLSGGEGVDGEGEQINPVISRPEFFVDVEKGDTTLSFSCSFENEDYSPDQEEMAGDLFHIDKISLYKGEWKETNYEINADVIDGNLYELLMNFLDEKGITNEFVFKVSELSTAYEHSNYISLLRELKKFASK